MMEAVERSVLWLLVLGWVEDEPVKEGMPAVAVVPVQERRGFAAGDFLRLRLLKSSTHVKCPCENARTWSQQQ